MTMKELFEEKIAEVNEAYPSIFTKEDVVKLLVNIQNIMEDIEPTINDTESIAEKLQIFEEDFTTIIKDKIQTFDYEDNISLELRYSNQIEVDFDYNELENDVEAKITDLFREFRQSLNIVEVEAD